MAVTAKPRFVSSVHKQRPMNPDAPVTRARMGEGLFMRRASETTRRTHTLWSYLGLTENFFATWPHKADSMLEAMSSGNSKIFRPISTFFSRTAKNPAMTGS
jgi:hypothetical protein